MNTDVRRLAAASRSWLIAFGLFVMLAGRVFGQAPTITSPPLSKLVTAGQPVSFTITASSGQTMSYQWKHNGQLVPGAAEATLSIAAAARGDAGWYQVAVSNATGTTKSVFCLDVAFPNS